MAHFYSAKTRKCCVAALMAKYSFAFAQGSVIESPGLSSMPVDVVTEVLRARYTGAELAISAVTTIRPIVVAIDVNAAELADVERSAPRCVPVGRDVFTFCVPSASAVFVAAIAVFVAATAVARVSCFADVASNPTAVARVSCLADVASNPTAVARVSCFAAVA